MGCEMGSVCTQHMLHALRLSFRHARVNMKCLGNFYVPIQSWQCDNIPKGIFKNTLCIVLTSACYTQCIHAFRPHIWIHADFHPQSDSIQENKVISHLFLLHHFVYCQLFLTKRKRKKCDAHVTRYNMSRNAMSQARRLEYIEKCDACVCVTHQNTYKQNGCENFTS